MAGSMNRGIVLLLIVLGIVAVGPAGRAAQAQTANSTSPALTKISVPSGSNMVWHGDPIQVIVTTGASDASNPRLVQPILRDRDSGARVEFQLCVPSGDCRPRALQGKTSHPLELRSATSRIRPGNYVGNITIVADGDPEGESAEMSLYVSGRNYRLLGVLAIAVGVVLAWLLTVKIRNRIARIELRKVLDLLESRAASLKEKLIAAFGDAAPNKAPRSFAVLGRIDADLTEARGLLPPGLPLPGQAPWANQTAFEALVSAMDGRLDGLSVIVDDGLVPASAIGAPGGDEAVAKIDALADQSGLLSLPELTRKVLELLDAARDRPEYAPGPVSARSTASEKYRSEVVLLGAVSWGVILVGTILAGTAALILPDKDFGRINDYVVCLLWGLGVPVAGGQITSLGADAVRTALSVGRPTSA